MSVRLPDKAGQIVNGDNAAWALISEAANAAGQCRCEIACSLETLLSDPKGSIPLSEIRNCPSLNGEFDPVEVVECYCLISASRGTKPSVDSIMDTADEELANAKTSDERIAAMSKAGRAGGERLDKMLELYSSLLKSSLGS